MPTKLRVNVRGRWYTVEVGDLDTSPVHVLVDGQPVEVEIQPLSPAVARPGAPAELEEPAPVVNRRSAIKVFHSPMPGMIVSVAVKAGDQVVTGDEICVLEAMKMQQVLRADWSGIVRAVHVRPGQHVQEGAPIVELE